MLQAMKSAGRRKASAGSARVSAGADKAAPGRRASAGAGMLIAGAGMLIAGADMPRRVGMRENSGAHSAPRMRAGARMRVNMWRAAVIYRLKISKSWQKRGG